MGEMSRRPRVLIIMAAYNGEQFIEEQVASILGQIGVDINIVIWDDYSTDETWDIVTRLSEDLDNVKSYRHEVPKRSAGGNFLCALKLTCVHEYDFVAFSDQDDIWLPNKLKRGIQMMGESCSAGYSSSSIAFWPGGNQKVQRIGVQMKKFDHLFGGAGQGCTFILETSLAREVQSYLGHAECVSGFYYHDWLCYLVARSKGRKWYFDERPLIRYRQHDSNDTGVATSLHGIRKRVVWIKSGWYSAHVKQCANVALEVNPLDDQVLELKRLLNSPKSYMARLALARIVAFEGRRTFSERIFLIPFALLGWLQR